MIALCLLLLANDWLVVPGERIGPVRASTTKSELIVLFGAEVVKNGEINVGEGVCRWKTPQGVSIGTTLKELEKLNGGPFKLAGFAWDYEGAIISWEEGKMSRVFDRGKTYLRLRQARPAGAR